MVDFLVPDSWASSDLLPGRTVSCPRTSTLGPTPVQGYGVRLVSVGPAKLASDPIRDERTGRAAPRVWRRTVRLGKIEFDVPDSLLSELRTGDRIRVHLGEGRAAVSLFREGRVTLAYGALVGADLGDLVRIKAGFDSRTDDASTMLLPWIIGGVPAPLDDRSLIIAIGADVVGVTASGSGRHDRYAIWVGNRPGNDSERPECLALTLRGVVSEGTVIRAAQMLDVMGVRRTGSPAIGSSGPPLDFKE